MKVTIGWAELVELRMDDIFLLIEEYANRYYFIINVPYYYAYPSIFFNISKGTLIKTLLEEKEILEVKEVDEHYGFPYKNNYEIRVFVKKNCDILKIIQAFKKELNGYKCQYDIIFEKDKKYNFKKFNPYSVEYFIEKDEKYYKLYTKEKIDNFIKCKDFNKQTYYKIIVNDKYILDYLENLKEYKVVFSNTWWEKRESKLKFDIVWTKPKEDPILYC